jgi:pyruvate/2-oxoglutarate dehydrogenase complex dihydrolipoamide acyltransferase (E2) component
MRAAMRTALAAVLAWCIGAAAAAVLGLVGVSLIGAALADQAAPSQGPTAGESPAPDRQANDAISSPTAEASPTSPRSDKPSPTTSDQERLITSPGGTVLARCSGTDAYLVSLSPAPGYRVTRVDPGPAPETTLTFQSGQSQVELVVRCLSGVPHATIHRTTVIDDVGDD